MSADGVPTQLLDSPSREAVLTAFLQTSRPPFRQEMNPKKGIVDYYLDEFRAGRCDDAFHSLIEAEPSVVPDLVNAYDDASDIDTKVFIIVVVSEFRLNSSHAFLRHALCRDDPRIWQSALNGLALAESPEALDAMEHVLSSVTDADKRSWIEEAITDTKDAIERSMESRG